MLYSALRLAAVAGLAAAFQLPAATPVHNMRALSSSLSPTGVRGYALAVASEQEALASEDEAARAGAIEDCLVDPESEESLIACAEEAGVPEGTIFTMQPRDDGWNDVRETLTKAKDERAPAWNEIKEKYVAPASKAAKTTAKWTKLLAEEAAGSAPDLDVGKAGKAATESAGAAATLLPKVLQVVQKTRENARENPWRSARRQVAAPSPAKPKPTPKPKAQPAAARRAPKQELQPNPVRDAVSASANVGLIFASIAAVPAALLLYAISPDTFKF